MLQIPIACERVDDGCAKRYAYPEHVSGGKKPVQHESMHGNDAQKAAAVAAFTVRDATSMLFTCGVEKTQRHRWG